MSDFQKNLKLQIGIRIINQIPQKKIENPNVLKKQTNCTVHTS